MSPDPKCYKCKKPIEIRIKINNMELSCSVCAAKNISKEISAGDLEPSMGKVMLALYPKRKEGEE